MSHEELNAALEVLHRELADTENLAGEDVDQIRATLGEIQAVLDEKSSQSDTLSGRVTRTAKKFEQSHPVLTDSLGRIADILQQMGI